MWDMNKKNILFRIHQILRQLRQIGSTCDADCHEITKSGLWWNV